MPFSKAEKRYHSLDDAYRSGRLSDQDYQAAVNQISVQDALGREWKIQAYSGQWHVFQAGNWQPAEPPADELKQPVEQDTLPTDNNWFILRKGEEHGPYPWDQLMQFAAKGGMDETDKVWTETWTDWKAVSEVPDLIKHIKQPAVAKKPNKKKRNIILLIAGVMTLICVSTFVVFSGFFTLLLFGSQGPTSGSLTLGDMQVLTVTSVGVEGGQIRIDLDASELDGMTIEAPPGAYLGDLNFTIGETPILSHTFGEDFSPASPLVTIDNGQVFAHEPLTLRIPIQKTDDEFAMGFYYDKQTGALEGIPFISQSNEEIVLYTAHFSDILISTVRIVDIDDEIDTGFSPGTDDFQMKNYGTFLSPNGHCAGQSIAAMYYFNNIKSHSELRVSQQVPLWGRFDNETHITGATITPELYWDDASALRLSSTLQYHMVNRWVDDSLIRIDSPEHELFTYQDYIARDDELTFYAFAYAMQVTRQPQFIYISQSRNRVKPGAKPAAHAMIAYKISGNKIYVADPNFAGDSNKFVEIDTFFIPASFNTYNSGLNARDTSLLFDRFGYFGVSALVNESVIARHWQEVLSGSVVGQALFPTDVQIEIAVDMDDNGNLIFTDLLDGLALSAEGIARVDPQGRVLLRIREPDPADHIQVYFGDDYENYFDDQFLWLNLSEGEHDIGISHFHLPLENREHYYFVNFRRFMVTVGLSSETHPLEETVVEAEFDAGVVMRAALEQLGYEEKPAGFDCTSQKCVFDVHSVVGPSLNEVVNILIEARSGTFDPQAEIDFIAGHPDLYHEVVPTPSTYRGFETWTYRVGGRYQHDPLDNRVIRTQSVTDHLHILGPEWHFIIQVYTKCPEEAPQCVLSELRDPYTIANAILDAAAQLGMIDLADGQ
jgi:hypothetical protein